MKFSGGDIASTIFRKIPARTDAGSRHVVNPPRSDTPNSLVDRRRKEEVKTLLKHIRGVENIDAEFNDILAARNEARLVQNPWQNIIKSRCYQPQLVISILIPFFQYLIGINVIMLYALVLFEMIGFGSDASLMSAVITGVINVLVTCVSIGFAYRWGTRSLFIERGVQMLIFQIAVAALIGVIFGVTRDVTELPKWFTIVVVICIYFYVVRFAWSWGPLGWLYSSEIFSLEIRSAVRVFEKLPHFLVVSRLYIYAQLHLRIW
ncbi:Sugar transport protein 1 [Forsythia ovata]|uniref:Sugar transport protein 1 n=1 Tax=Forsythia ovata TaxID=205694 RepID=A0ABD1S5G3_9LAMI